MIFIYTHQTPDTIFFGTLGGRSRFPFPSSDFFLIFYELKPLVFFFRKYLLLNGQLIKLLEIKFYYSKLIKLIVFT